MIVWLYSVAVSTSYHVFHQAQHCLSQKLYRSVMDVAPRVAVMALLPSESGLKIHPNPRPILP
jgi:hypothetical protein